MPKLGLLARMSVVALCLTGHARALAGNDAPIRILCEDARLAAMCDEFAHALLDAQDQHPVDVTSDAHSTGDAHLVLRFEMARFTENVLSGHLVWRDRTGRSGAGATVDLTVMDAMIDDEMLRDYARQLLNLTDLPL